ncbi:hypothetical protein HMPREF0294_0846 [Corynebacterium glucuronolyticum ATCC 51867]|nr:hypothetical protein HMPREF0294_0846 [Corynebacterium glucuronolyticum ATCC 51867]
MKLGHLSGISDMTTNLSSHYKPAIIEERKLLLYSRLKSCYRA